jgi:hypothetical protein
VSQVETKTWKKRRTSEEWLARIDAMPVFLGDPDADDHKQPEVVNSREMFSFKAAFSRYGFKCSIVRRADGYFEIRRIK